MQLIALPWGETHKTSAWLICTVPAVYLSVSQAVYTAWTVTVSVAICLSLCSNFLFTGDAYIPRSEHSSFVEERSGVVYLE